MVNELEKEDDEINKIKEEVSEKQVQEISAESDQSASSKPLKVSKKPVKIVSTKSTKKISQKSTELVSKKPIEEDLKKPEINNDLQNSKKKKYKKTLITLIIILLVIDIISVFAYYKPDIKFININPSPSQSSTNNQIIPKNTTKKVSPVYGNCEDGTKIEECSKDKPYYCYQGELLKKAATCGCPTGYKVTFQDCKKIEQVSNST